MDFDASRPVWIQLVEDFTRKVIKGEWVPGERMPSTRELALDYRVNPNTVQKALTEMDRRGLTRSERASGRVVLETAPSAQTLREAEAGAIIDSALDQLRALGMAESDIRELVNSRLASPSRKESRNHDTPH